MINPGFRVDSTELSNAKAIRLMHEAAATLVNSALKARLSLLHSGFAMDHSLCQQFDKTAEEYDLVIQVLRGQVKREEPDENSSNP
jgi:hypothetical protein